MPPHDVEPTTVPSVTDTLNGAKWGPAETISASQQAQQAPLSYKSVNQGQHPLQESAAEPQHQISDIVVPAAPNTTQKPSSYGHDVPRFSSSTVECCEKSVDVNHGNGLAIQCDAMVLLKIIKACCGSYPSTVSGQLIGLDTAENRRDSLEVTDCFALPPVTDPPPSWNGPPKDINEERIQTEQTRYSNRMMDLLQTVNSDCLAVGWYQTMSLETFKDVDIVESLCEYQEFFDKAIVIGFDPRLASLGLNAFKVYRISSDFLAHHRITKDHSANTNRLLKSGKSLLKELPVRVNNPLLVEAFLLEWSAGRSSSILASSPAGASVDEGLSKYTKSNLSFVSGCLDELCAEQEKIMKYQKDSLKHQLQHKQMLEKRRQENDQRKLRGEEELPISQFEASAGMGMRRVEAPNQLGTLLMSSRVDVVRKEVRGFAAQNLARVMLASGGSKR